MSDKTFDLCVWNSDDVEIVPQFLEVLKAAHGQPLTSSKEIFLWKHRDNPVGPSIFTYAVDTDSDSVVALQVLSPRRLFYNEQVHPGYESNDTSTHPNYRRRGLFTRLLELCMEEADERNAWFALGFPNINSKRGFLKFGWKDVGKIETLVKPLRPLKTGFFFLTNRKSLKRFSADTKSHMSAGTVASSLPEDMEEILEARQCWQGLWAGHRDRTLLEWRFVHHPYHSYEIVKSEEGFAFVLLGQRGILREGKIVEAFFRVAQKKLKRAVKGLLRQIREQLDPDIVSTILTVDHPYHDAFVRSGFYKAPSDMMFFNYPLSNCPSNLAEQPWAITGTDIDTQ